MAERVTHLFWVMRCSNHHADSLAVQSFAAQACKDAYAKKYRIQGASPAENSGLVSSRITAGDSQGPETRRTILEVNIRWLGMSIGEGLDIV